jgi:hypothetical protein
MNRHEFEQLLQRYMLGDCTTEEKIRVCYWYQKIEGQHNFLLNRKEHDLAEQKMLKFIEEKLEENNRYLKNKTSADGLLNTCLLYAGTIEIFLLI